MSVEIKDLTKIYGNQRAIDSISFEAKKGEILGFLGPNGAGKTTTMKIITCFIPQNEGEAKVCGFDTRTQTMEVRRRIGYLPEHNPLYKEMYVREYLGFVAGLHKVSDKKKRVAEMIDLTGLQKEQNKPIKALSKGYRQRVGLAQAMIHDPEVLILDEPTSGLDPNQLSEIRQVIKKLGEEKTVILSTHIMQEVQALCDRVLIINNGKLVANDSIDSLKQRVKGEIQVEVEFLESAKKEYLEKIKWVTSVKSLGGNRWALTSNQEVDIRPQIFKHAISQNLTLVEMNRTNLSVEDVFQKLTKN